MLVTDRHRTRGRDLVELVAEATRGGVGLVQVRERDLPDGELRSLVRRIAAAVPAGTPVLVNGRSRIARQLELGLHLPASAPAPPPAEIAGKLAGRSVHDQAELGRAIAERMSYAIAGTVYDTGPKRGAGPALIRKLAGGAGDMPLFAIGGITVTRVPEVIHAGAHGVAVCGAILEDNDPARVAQALGLALQVASRVERGDAPGS